MTQLVRQKDRLLRFGSSRVDERRSVDLTVHIDIALRVGPGLGRGDGNGKREKDNQRDYQGFFHVSAAYWESGFCILLEAGDRKLFRLDSRSLMLQCGWLGLNYPGTYPILSAHRVFIAYAPTPKKDNKSAGERQS